MTAQTRQWVQKAEADYDAVLLLCRSRKPSRFDTICAIGRGCLMKLQNEIELQNTRRKLSALEELIAAKANSPDVSAVREIALQGMKSTAQKIRSEIDEYERTHQTA